MRSLWTIRCSSHWKLAELCPDTENLKPFDVSFNIRTQNCSRQWQWQDIYINFCLYLDKVF